MTFPRAASANDLAAIIRIFLACWQESYAGLLPESTRTTMSQARAMALWTSAIDSGQAVDVAVHGSTVVGVIRYVARPDAVGIVESLYVDPASQGSGAGRVLLTHAVDQLTRLGMTSARLWVFAANIPARKFYERMGWVPTGASRTQEGFGELEIELGATLDTGRAGSQPDA